MLQLVKSLPFHIPEAWKRYPFRAEPPHTGHYREYPLPVIQSVQLNEALQNKQGFAEYVEELKRRLRTFCKILKFKFYSYN